MLEILAAPVVACLILAGIHCYLGIHVLMREVIFVDLALAQLAALGAAAALLAGLGPRSAEAYFISLLFTFGGAALFSSRGFRDRRVSQEAFIGIVYAVSSALAILLLSQSAVEREEIEHMLIGRLLFVEWLEVGVTAALYAGVTVIHVLLGRRFLEISAAHAGAAPFDRTTRLLDFLFYATFGIVVTSAVKMAGVLLVFSFLIVPAACAMLFFTRARSRLLAGWVVGALGSGAGVTASALWDFPTGASVVTALGFAFALCAVAARAQRFAQAS